MRQHARRLRVVAATLAILAIAAPAAALVLTVDSEDDRADLVPGDGRCAANNGQCTLRAAVQEANASPGNDRIIVPEGRYGLELAGEAEDAAATGDLDLADDVTIDGAGSNTVLIDGRGSTAVLHVLPGVSAEIRGVIVFGGLQRAGGDNAAGVFNQGTLHMSDCRVASNVGPIPFGTALKNDGSATIERTVFDANTPTAITNHGELFLSHVTLQYNGPTAAIDNDEGTLTMAASEIAFQTGLGLYNQGTAQLDHSRIHDTRPGPAIVIPSGDTRVLDSVIEHNEGGGINNDGVLRVERSTLRANSPAGDGTTGGVAGVAGVTPFTAVTNTDATVIIDSAILAHRNSGLYNEEGSMTLINVTVSGNSSEVAGGAISNNGELEIHSSTITANSSRGSSGAGGIWTEEDSANFVRVTNSIVAGNDVAGTAGDCRGPITSLGYNVFGDLAGCAQLTTSTGDLVNADPGLEPLADNGGPTPTHALRPDSVAVDAGYPGAPDSNPLACPSTDQRGGGRPQGAGCDIGAFELTRACGNGVLDSGERCDDGNTAPGDCCSPLCTFEPLAGDCDGNGAVEIAELVRAVDAALANPPADLCPAADADGDGRVAINDLIASVRSALNGCQPN